MLKKLSQDAYKSLILQAEGEALEFKEAKINFPIKSLFDYAAAIANEGGGKLVLGVDDERKIVGTQVYTGTENKISHKIFQSTGLKTQSTAYEVLGERILIIDIPSRPTGRPVQSGGNYRYPMRVGESIIEMDAYTLGQIFKEISPDHSATFIKGATTDDLNQDNLNKFKVLWAKKTGRESYLKKDNEEILSSLNLIDKENITLTALILFGTEKSLAKFVPDSEIVFEWRNEPKQTNYDYRISWREGFIGIYDEIWKTLDARNVRQSYQDGLIQREIRAFDEKPFREALLNAVSHRDYSMTGHSIFIKASPESYFIESPGGLIGGINLQNIFDKTAWRNRLLAEVLEKAGLVERSGQGIDDIFEITIRNGKGTPKIEELYLDSFKITIPAKIEDIYFINYLELISQKKGLFLRLGEILELERIRKNGPLKKIKHKDRFLENNLIDKVGQGKGSKYILSHDYYKITRSEGVYTKLSGISRNKSKELILNHIQKNNNAERAEFNDVFPELSPQDISNLLQELRRDNKIYFNGPPKTGVWKIKTD